MSDNDTLILHKGAADHDSWSKRAGALYWDMAHWLRQMAARCTRKKRTSPMQQITMRVEDLAELLHYATRYVQVGPWLDWPTAEPQRRAFFVALAREVIRMSAENLTPELQRRAG